MGKLFNYLVLSRLIIFFLPLILGNTTISNLADVWNRWDAPHYLYIAEHGYKATGDEANFIVFPPLYPLIVFIMNMFVKQFPISGVLISNSLFILGALVFYRLVRLDFDQKVSTSAVVFLSLFPTSYFFSAPYAESLFLFLTVTSLYLIRKGMFVEGSFFGTLSYLTRHFGLILLPAMLIEILSKTKKDRFKFLTLTFFAFALGLATYLFVNYLTFGDPLAFTTILREHWFKGFELPWKGIVQSWKVGVSGKDDYAIFIGLTEAVTATAAWLLMPLAIKKLKPLYSTYYILGVIMMTSTGFILSTPRYLLSIPPFFILLSTLLQNKYAKIIWLLVSTALLVYLLNRYSLGPWSF